MFSLIESPDLTVWFTSDLHLGHKRDFVWEARGYKSAENHTNSIIETINDCVREGDILFNMGDLCLNTTRQELDNYLDRIVCKNMWCLWGNHNNPHEKNIYRPERDKLTNKGVREVYPVKYKNLTYLGHYYEVKVNDQAIVLFHYALQVWNHCGNGAWALVGHSHGSLPTILPGASYGKILDVGWDVFKKPMSFSELKLIMDEKPILAVDHHSSK
jgi:calcineurin-like phosphoesterase family protein